MACSCNNDVVAKYYVEHIRNGTIFGVLNDNDPHSVLMFETETNVIRRLELGPSYRLVNCPTKKQPING